MPDKQQVKIKNVYIIGLGAIGAMYAAKFSQVHGINLKIIADAGRAAKISGTDYIINNRKFRFKTISPGEHSVVPVADLIIISVKSPALLSAVETIKPFIGENTVIMSLLNGISSEETIGVELGMQHVLYAYGVGMDAIREKETINYLHEGKIVFGEKTGFILSERVLKIKELFEAAEIQYEIPADIIRAQWTKFMLNTAVNQASVILNAPFIVFQQNTAAKNLMLMAAAEVLNLSRHTGVNLNEQDMEEMIRIINKLNPVGKTSMLQDFEAGRTTEVDTFAGTVIELGKKFNIPTPVNAVFLQIIKALEGKPVI